MSTNKVSVAVVAAHVEGVSLQDPAPEPTLQGLPNDVIASVLGFLEAKEIGIATTVNRKLRFDVTPLIHHLRITQVKEMEHSVARLFPNVRNIEFGGRAGYFYDETGFITKLVPFLQSFEHLENASFPDALKITLALVLQVPEVEGGQHESERYALPIATIVHNLCDAFGSGALSNRIKIEYLFCPRRHHPDAGICRLCRCVVENFPIEHLLTVTADNILVSFLDMSSSLDQTRQIEEWMIPTIINRPRGREVMTRIYHILQENTST